MRRPAALLLSAVLVALLLSACGGGEGSTRGSGAAMETGYGQPQREAGSGEAHREGGERSYEGGERSIETFGSEAGGSERDAVLAVFTGYLNAIAAEDYGTACSHLTAAVQGSLEQLVVKRLKARGCPAILPKLLAPTAAAIAREQAAGRITKVRVQGDRAFVVFHAPGAKLYMLTMAREGGEWKAALVAASVLVPSAATLGQ